MGYMGFKKPDNKFICYGPNVILIQEEKAEAATIKPGLVVMKGTNDDDIVVCDGVTSAPIGFAGYEQSFLGSASVTSNRPADVNSAYATGAKVPVLGGGGFVGVGTLAAGVAVKKGDLLASWSDGTVVPVVPMLGGLGVKVPYAKSTAEKDTGIDLPGGLVVTDVVVQSITAVASATIDIGILSTESGGDADGFVDGESIANTGFINHVNGSTAPSNNTIGDLLVNVDIKSADTSALYFSLPKFYVCDGTAKSVTYTTSNHAVAGNFYIVAFAPGFEVVGIAEETLAVSTDENGVITQDVLVRSLI